MTAMDVDDGIRSKKRRRRSTIDRCTADRCQGIDISTYHRTYLTSLRLVVKNHEEIQLIQSPPVVDLIAPWLITDNAHTTNMNKGRVRIPQTPGLSISEEDNLRYALVGAVVPAGVFVFELSSGKKAVRDARHRSTKLA